MRLSLATRIFIGHAVVLITFGAVSLFSISEMRRNQIEIRLLSEGYLYLAQNVADIENFHATHERDTARLYDEKNRELKRALVQLARYFHEVMSGKLKNARSRAKQVVEFAPSNEAAFLKEIVTRIEDLQLRYVEYEGAADTTFAVILADNQEPDMVKARLERLQDFQGTLKANIGLLRQLLERHVLDSAHQAQERERRTGAAIILLSVVAIGMGLLATAWSARTLRPVRTLIDFVSRVGKGDYSAQLGLKGENEIALLAREFDVMSKNLKEREEELKQKQGELLRAERLAAVGRVSAQIAHEVRNPLSSIALNVEMLDEQLEKARFNKDDEHTEAKRLLHAVTREVDRLTEVTEAHLRLARVPPPSLQPESLNGLIEEALSFVREELERAQVTVVRQLAAGEVPVNVDEAQLRQVLLNLIRNAREAMAGGGTLTFETRQVGARAELRISDTGRGIPEGVRASLFEPFFSTKERGTGLGLSLSRQILEAHRGTIVAEKTTRGASFLITLPAAG
ncbi:MAG: HAMP domain-containing protein [Myxococcaceae bacterium]|nr:HAMP domain-containing protein [Myxococcaceae bacterium]